MEGAICSVGGTASWSRNCILPVRQALALVIVGADVPLIAMLRGYL
jgi:hypothetical protein